MAGPTNKERLDAHAERLTQIETTLGIKPPEPKKSFLKQKYELVVAHKGTSLILAIILCCVGIVGKYWIDHKTEWWNHDVDGRVGAVLEKPDGVQDTLKQVRDTVNRTDEKLKTLEPFIHDVIQHQFDSAAKLSPSALQARLPAIQHLAAVAQNQEVKVDTTALNVLGHKLSTVDTKAAAFWPTAAQFVSYRSQINVVDSQSLSRPNMANCTDNPPTPMEYRMTAEEEYSTKEETNRVGLDSSRFIPAIYENCRFVLDSPEEAEGFPLLGNSFDLEFKNCQIIYNGGPIAIVTPNPRVSFFNGKGPTRGDVFAIKGQKLRFENCLFLFTIKAVPPQEGQQMTHELLAQSGPTFSYGRSALVAK
jgi:hypothetical protein